MGCGIFFEGEGHLPKIGRGFGRGCGPQGHTLSQELKKRYLNPLQMFFALCYNSCKAAIIVIQYRNLPKGNKLPQLLRNMALFCCANHHSCAVVMLS